MPEELNEKNLEEAAKEFAAIEETHAGIVEAGKYLQACMRIGIGIVDPGCVAISMLLHGLDGVEVLIKKNSITEDSVRWIERYLEDFIEKQRRRRGPVA